MVLTIQKHVAIHHFARAQQYNGSYGQLWRFLKKIKRLVEKKVGVLFWGGMHNEFADVYIRLKGISID